MIGLIVISLTFLGLVILFSALQAMHIQPTVLRRKQLIRMVLATLAGGVEMLVDLAGLGKYTLVLDGGALLQLGLVLVPGRGVKVNGRQTSKSTR